MARILASIVLAALAVVGVMAAPVEEHLVKRDMTSPVTEIFGYTDGRWVDTKCKNGKVPARYNSNYLGACSRNANDCGRQIYAYLGNGNPHIQGATSIIDVCPTKGVPSKETLGLTYASFKQLGGTAKDGKLYNVNWKFLD